MHELAVILIIFK